MTNKKEREQMKKRDRGRQKEGGRERERREKLNFKWQKKVEKIEKDIFFFINLRN